jgi:hypothetical protein
VVPVVVPVVVVVVVSGVPRVPLPLAAVVLMPARNMTKPYFSQQ